MRSTSRRRSRSAFAGVLSCRTRALARALARARRDRQRERGAAVCPHTLSSCVWRGSGSRLFLGIGPGPLNPSAFSQRMLFFSAKKDRHFVFSFPRLLLFPPKLSLPLSFASHSSVRASPPETCVYQLRSTDSPPQPQLKKRLQRHRDQIKTWVASSDIKDKRALTDARDSASRQALG